MDLNSTKELISEIKRGNMVLLMDDEDRENEGDVILAGEKVTAEKINFIWDEIDNWWNKTGVQNARKEFCERYAKLNNNRILKLRQILLS